MIIKPDLENKLKQLFKREVFESQNKIVVVSAFPLSQASRELIIAKLNQPDVDIEFSVNPDLIAGFTIQQGSQMIDLSINGKLNKLQNKLL